MDAVSISQEIDTSIKDFQNPSMKHALVLSSKCAIKSIAFAADHCFNWGDINEYNKDSHYSSYGKYFAAGWLRQPDSGYK